MSKQELRGRMRGILAAMSPEQRVAAGADIAARVWTVPEVASARTLLLYAALPDEVPTARIASEARRRGMTVTYPRCLPATREMRLHRIDREEELVGGRYGILEPAERCEPVAVEEIDAALIPGLAWDRAGRRLGRGAGYYDRLLARPDWRGVRCGIFFSLQEVSAVPADPWDVPLEAIVTEREAIRITRPG